MLASRRIRVVLGAAGAALSLAAAVAGAQARAAAPADRFSASPSLSANGRFVAFDSFASNLVAGDTNHATDAFVRDRLAATTTRVSVSSGGRQANEASYTRAISGDGRYVAFSSYASSLGTADPNSGSDVFVRDRTTGNTTLVSVARGGRQANGNSGDAAISASGRLVAFVSSASNLVAGDTNKCTYPWGIGEQKRHACEDVFVRDRATGKTARVSVSSSGVQANGESEEVAISANGRFVAFSSYASNLVAGDTITCAPTVTGTNIPPTRHNCRDVFVRDRVRRTTELVSVSSTGVHASGPTATLGSYQPAISADGRYVVFASDASNLVADDTNKAMDVFVRDRATHMTTRVDVSGGGEQANAPGLEPAISADGRFVAFSSFASNLVAGDTNASEDVFLRDRVAGKTERVSIDSAGRQTEAYTRTAAIKYAGDPSLSANGRFVAFSSAAPNLVPGDTNGLADIFVRDRRLGTTTLVSVGH